MKRKADKPLVQKAWGLKTNYGGGFLALVCWTRKDAKEEQREHHTDCTVVRIEIREIRT